MIPRSIQPKVFVVFDAQVPALQQLIAGLAEGAEVLVLNPHQDGIAQISQWLAGQRLAGHSVSALHKSLHIVSHGQPGSLQLGQTQLSAANLTDYAEHLQGWASAEIWLYGCEVGQGETGRNFIAQLSELTGARIAASETVTGNAALGGDWNLNITTGKMESSLVFDAATLAVYPGTLAAGDLDSSFGTGGRVTTDFGAEDTGNSIALQVDGKLVVAGSSYDPITDDYDFAVTRYNSDGSLDTSFGAGGKVTTDFGGYDIGNSIALQVDGKLVVAGQGYNPITGNDDFAVTRYNSDGSLDTSFGTGGKVTTDFGGTNIGNSIALQVDGKLVVAGQSYNPITGNDDFAVTRYNSDGSLDTSFGTGGKVITDFGSYDYGNSIALQADGKLVVAGSSYDPITDNYDFAVTRYNSDGSLDTSFGTGGKVTTDFGSYDYGGSIALQSDGKLVVAGQGYNPITDNYDFAVTRYNSDGSLDTSFGTGGKVTTDFGGGDIGSSITLQADGKLVVAGQSYNPITGNYNFVVTRYNSNGSLDTRFGTGGKVTTDFGGTDVGRSIALQADGKLVVAGKSNGNFALARYEAFNLVVSTSSTNPSYSEHGAATLLDSAITVTSASSDFNNGSLTVRFANGGIASDRLSLLPGGSLTLDGRYVSVSNTIIGTYRGGIGSEDLVIDFSFNATPANVEIVMQAIGYSNIAEDLTNGSRTVELVLRNALGDISTVNKAIAITGINDAPIIGQTTLLYDASLNTTPNAQGWAAFVPTGVIAAATNGVTNLNSSANAGFYAGYSRVSSQPLDAAQGFVVNFSAEVLSESIEPSANKNGDGKPDRAGFSIIVISSDKTKAIELGFNKIGNQLSIFAQEDGTSQSIPALAPNAPGGSPYLLFTQAESALFTPAAGLNTYDLAVTGNTYTLYANGTAILSGKLRNYTAFSPTLPTPDPYETPNLIFLGDDTTSARANINLGSVKVTTNTGLTARTVNEDTALAITNLYIGDWDNTDNLTVTLTVAQGKLNITNAGGATVANNNSSTVTLTGSQNQINQILSPGNLTYQGNLNFNGSDTLTVSATDGVIANPITKTMAITVNSVYDAPALAGTPATSINQDASYSFTPTVTNPENASLTFSITNKPSWATFDPVTGTLSGTPGNADLGSTNNIEISVSDGTSINKLSQFNLTVNNVNDAPTSANQTVTTNEDTAYTFQLADFPFSDVDSGDSLQSIKITQLPGAGSLTLNGNPVNAEDEISIDDLNNGNLKFMPAKDGNGQGYASLQFQVGDGSEYSETQTLNVDVDADNDAPTSANKTVTTDEDAAYTFQLADFPFADIDSGDSLQKVKIIQLPGAGALTLDGQAVNAGDEILVGDLTLGKLKLTSAANANGTGYTNFQFQVSDGTEFSSTQTLTVDVIAVNDAPEISGVPKTSVRQGDNYDFIPTVTDLEGDSLSFSIVNQPNWAEFDSTTGKLSGTPTNDNIAITENIIIRVSDGLETIELAPFNLSVDNVNDLPIISGQPGLTVSEDSFYSFTPVANDPDFGDQISFSIVNKPAWASFDPSTGELSGTPTNEQVGTTQNILILVSDGQETVELAPFSLTVINTNDAPTLPRPLIDAVAKAGQIFSLNLENNRFQDVDLGDSLRFSAKLTNGQPLPAWLKFDPQTLSFSGIPVNPDAGQLVLQVTATDISGLEASGSFNLTVESAPPTGLPTTPIQIQPSPMGVNRQQGTAKADVLRGGWLKDDVLMGGNGNDVMISGQGQAKAGNDRLYGQGGNDRLYSGSGTDLLDGGTGNDRAWGGNGRDLLLGGSGNDVLSGQNDDDILVGGAGNDTLSGGLGRDMFVFTNVNEGTDTITDFNVNQDVIDLRQIFAAPEFGGTTDFTRFQQFIQLTQRDSNQVAVELDVDGSGAQGFKTLAILQNVQMSQITAKHFVIALSPLG